MSGLITSPHFNGYFKSPDAISLGTMVAVLEVGAFGMTFQCGPIISAERA